MEQRPAAWQLIGVSSSACGRKTTTCPPVLAAFMRGPHAIVVSSGFLPPPSLRPPQRSTRTRIILSTPAAPTAASGLLTVRAVSFVYGNIIKNRQQYKYGCAVKYEFDHETYYTCWRAWESYFSFIYSFLFNINNVLLILWSNVSIN